MASKIKEVDAHRCQPISSYIAPRRSREQFDTYSFGSCAFCKYIWQYKARSPQVEEQCLKTLTVHTTGAAAFPNVPRCIWCSEMCNTLLFASKRGLLYSYMISHCLRRCGHRHCYTNQADTQHYKGWLLPMKLNTAAIDSSNDIHSLCHYFDACVFMAVHVCPSFEQGSRLIR